MYIVVESCAYYRVAHWRWWCCQRRLIVCSRQSNKIESFSFRCVYPNEIRDATTPSAAGLRVRWRTVLRTVSVSRHPTSSRRRRAASIALCKTHIDVHKYARISCTEQTNKQSAPNTHVLRLTQQSPHERQPLKSASAPKTECTRKPTENIRRSKIVFSVSIDCNCYLSQKQVRRVLSVVRCILVFVSVRQVSFVGVI